jgi:CheY-like chemotaxis protein
MKSEIPRRRLRRLLAHSLIAGAGIVAAPLDVDAATDPVVDDDPGDPAEAVAAVASRLEQMNPFDATELAANGALSPDPGVRHMLAEALVTPFPLVGADVVIDHLGRDPDPDVRAAAARAATARGLAAVDATHALRVLVIDDRAAARAALCAELTRLGCEVIGTSSRIAVHDVAWRDLVDVVVAQHQPPFTDGARLVELVRDQAPDLPAIVLRRPIEDDELARVIDALVLAL